MRSTDLLGNASRLQKATARLKEQWSEVKTHWNDKASQDFEKTCLQPIPAQIALISAAIHKLADILAQAEKDLFDREMGQEP
jgi:uncharacterized protein YukE